MFRWISPLLKAVQFDMFQLFSPKGIIMRSRELQAILASLAGRTIGEVDQRTRVLRAHSEISSGPRGLAAPHMNHVEAAAHILALVSRRAVDAGEVSRRLMTDCRYVPHPHHKDFIRGSLSVGGATALVMEADPSEDGLFKSFEIHESGHKAWLNVTRRDGSQAKLLFTTAGMDGLDGAEAYEGIERDTLGNRFVVSAQLLVGLGIKISADLRDEDEADDLRKAG